MTKSTQDISTAETALSHLLNTSANYALLTAEEEKQLARIIQSNDEQRALRARNTLVTHNIRLVHSIAKKHLRTNVDLEDLVAIGMFGLIRAAEKFDPTQDVKFATYATWWIRQSITRYCNERAHQIHLPTHAVTARFQIARRIEELQKQGITEISEEQLAKDLSLSLTTVKNILEYNRIFHTLVYLDAPVDATDDATNASKTESYADPQAVSPELQLLKNETTEYLAEALKQLPERQRDIIIRRSGFQTGKSETLAEISNAYNISRERTRQLEKDGLLRLKRILLNQKFRELPIAEASKLFGSLSASERPQKALTSNTI